MKFTIYLILTQIFEEYGKHRFLEGMFMEAKMPEEQHEEKVKAGDAWQKAFAIIKEMEDANEQFRRENNKDATPKQIKAFEAFRQRFIAA